MSDRDNSSARPDSRKSTASNRRLPTARMNCRLVGLTGGIGTGKSTVADILEGEGLPVVRSDRIARELTAKGSNCLDEIVRTFGSRVLTAEGELDRRKLGAIVFADTEQRDKLEGILHSPLRDRSQALFLELCDSGARCVVYESPLLLETGRSAEMDLVVLVTAAPELRVQRVVQRDGLSEAEVRARIGAQLDESSARQRADHVIENNGTRDELAVRVRHLRAQIAP